MKVLWVTNTIFPDLAKSINKNTPVVGGWMYGLAKDLARLDNIELTVATTKDAFNDYNTEIGNINYYLLKGINPITKYYDKSLNTKWFKLIKEVKPDIVHIHGTEYAQGLSLMKTCPNLNYVISIQGLTSICSRYYNAGISYKEILRTITFRDIFKRQSILNEKKDFWKRGEKVEKEYIIRSSHIIGRTDWDKSHVKMINPNCTYHFCNESLRDSFYESRKWDITKVQKETIFLSQAGKPLKGLHKVLEALYLLKDEFPNLKLRVAGADIIGDNTIKSKIKISGYGKYIKSLLNKFDLMDRVTFTGSLNEKQMILEYLNCNIFICPSSIENSPNSLGEAQLLGVPAIASYVGGVSNMISHGKTGMIYRFEEVEMLAQHIKSVFLTSELALDLSKESIIEASKRHNRRTNLNQLMNIYRNIVNH